MKINIFLPSVGKRGTQVVIPYRGTDDDRRHLKLMGDLGQIVPLVRHYATRTGWERWI